MLANHFQGPVPSTSKSSGLLLKSDNSASGIKKKPILWPARELDTRGSTRIVNSIVKNQLGSNELASLLPDLWLQTDPAYPWQIAATRKKERKMCSGVRLLSFWGFAALNPSHTSFSSGSEKKLAFQYRSRMVCGL